MRVLLILLFVSTTAFAQDDINEQVWKPFIKGFNEGNTELFMSVHSKDLVRSGRDSKQVLDWDQYNKQTTEWYSKRSAKYNIELHFTERISNDHQAIDVGVYKTSWSTADGKSGVGYGRFHVVLRKENGTWKILVDTDSNEGKTIGEAQFIAAKPME
jgi:ketosteroid isomerase-like protein